MSIVLNSLHNISLNYSIIRTKAVTQNQSNFIMCLKAVSSLAYVLKAKQINIIYTGNSKEGRMLCFK